MVVKIENMDMPRNCFECKLPHIEAHYHKNQWAKTFHLCPFLEIYVDGCQMKRHPKCPLKECE